MSSLSFCPYFTFGIRKTDNMETILAPTDFSPAATNAVNYAVELAKFFDAELVLVNAYAVPPASHEAGIAVEILSTMHELAVKQLNELKKQLLLKNPYLTIECAADMGVPFRVVESGAKKFDADLIVMGIVG